jgi:hypothetical protein
VLEQLQKEMPRASFDNWVRDTRSVSFDQGVFSVAAHNAYACDWLESRLKNTATRILTDILNSRVKINFVIAQDDEPVDDEETANIGARIEALDSTSYRDEVHPDHVVMLDGYALRLLEHGDMTPKEMSLWVGFRQAIFCQHKAGKGTIHNIPHYDVMQFAMMSRAAFFREMKNAKEIGGREYIAGGHVEILPEDAHSDSYANRYRVLISPLLTRHDCAVIESILLADIAMVATHDEAQQAVLQTLNTLINHNPADWINQEVNIRADQPQRIQDIVRHALGWEGDFPEDLATACEQVYDRIMGGFGKVFITHYFLRVVVPSLKLTHAQAWAIIILRDKCWFDHASGTQRDYALVPGGLSTLARWVGVSGQSITDWMQKKEFKAFVLVADRERLDIPDEWSRAKTEIIFVSQQEPQISEALEDGKVRLGWRRSETLIKEKCDSLLVEMRLGLSRSETQFLVEVRLGFGKSETLLNNLNITVFNNKNMDAKPASARSAAPTPPIEPIPETPQTPQTRIEAFPADCQSGAQLMLELFNVIAPQRPHITAKGGDFAKWVNGIRTLDKTATEYDEGFETAMRLTHQLWNKSPFSVSHPAALKNAMVSALAQKALTRATGSKTSQSVPTALEINLRNFVPRGE